MNEKDHAKEVYEQIKGSLKGQEGKIVAIDLINGDYFLGNSAEEAYENGRKKHPAHKFFFKRVGAKAAFFVGAL